MDTRPKAAWCPVVRHCACRRPTTLCNMPCKFAAPTGVPPRPTRSAPSSGRTTHPHTFPATHIRTPICAYTHIRRETPATKAHPRPCSPTPALQPASKTSALPPWHAPKGIDSDSRNPCGELHLLNSLTRKKVWPAAQPQFAGEEQRHAHPISLPPTPPPAFFLSACRRSLCLPLETRSSGTAAARQSTMPRTWAMPGWFSLLGFVAQGDEMLTLHPLPDRTSHSTSCAACSRTISTTMWSM